MSKINEGFKVDKSEYKKIYDDENYLLVVPLTHTASCKYGANTKWCTTKRDDDSDFEEHITMGVLAYLIIKNPNIYNQMSSKKYGLYRGNGYELKDLIVYDELNNEHLNGVKYLKNEFDKADRDSDGIKIIDIYNKHYQENSINFMMNRPEKINEGVSIESIKPLCNRMVVHKKGGFGNLSKSSMIYYTKGGKYVTSDALKNNGLNIPFNIGDSIHEIMKWIEENKYEVKQYSRTGKSKRLKEDTEEKTYSPSQQRLIDAFNETPDLYNLCYIVLSGLYEDDMLEKHIDNEVELRSIDLVVDGRKGYFSVEFEDDDDFSQFFADGQTDNYELWNVRYRQPDYEYYSDGAWDDVDSESYHIRDIDNDDLKKLYNVLIEKGLIAKREKIEGRADDFELDEYIADTLKSMFNKDERRLAEEYQEFSTRCYAEGFSKEMEKVHNDWLEYGFKTIGLIERDELREYEIQVSGLFKYLIRPSHRGYNIQNTIEKSKHLRHGVGSQSDLFNMSDAKYEYFDDSERGPAFTEFKKDWVASLIDKINNEYELEVDEFKEDRVKLLKYGLDILKSPAASYDNYRYLSTWDLQRSTYDNHKYKTANGEEFIYLGYSIDTGYHRISIVNTNNDVDYGRSYIRQVESDDIITLLTQTSLKLKESPHIIKRSLFEQDEETMSLYYAMMSDLVKYYGEGNVDLIGSPAKIVIRGNNIRLKGETLVFTTKGKKEIVKIEDYSTNRQGVVYPSIKLITNRIPKTPPTKKETKVVTNENYVDGTKLKASQNFWNTIKTDEGSVKQKGEPVLKAYKLGDGRVTIGWGHTGALSEPTPKVGDVITKEQAQKYLQNDATESANCVRRFLNEWKTDDTTKNNHMITQNMFDVLVSLVFNAGCQGLRKSNFIKLVKQKKYKSAANILPKDSTMINGKFSKGLISRRQRESKLFLK
jgi:lysozyme